MTVDTSGRESDRRVYDGLELNRSQPAQPFLPASPVISALDPSHNRDPQFFTGSPGTTVEHVLLQETELQYRGRLLETTRVYRATADGYQTGLSWTTSFERAYWFATRLGTLAGFHHEIYERVC